TANLIDVLINYGQGTLPSQIAEQNELAAQRSRGEAAAAAYLEGWTDEANNMVDSSMFANFIQLCYAEMERQVAEMREMPTHYDPMMIQDLIRQATQLPTFTLGESPGGALFLDAANVVDGMIRQEQRLERINELERQRLEILTGEMRATAEMSDQLRAQEQERARMESTRAAQGGLDEIMRLMGIGETTQRNW